MRKRRHAFTMLELVMIIAVVGILTAVMIPRLNNADAALHNAARQLVSHIRYTQHLAINDDKLNTTDNNWYKKRWVIIFNNDSHTNNKWAYTIFADTATANPSKPNIAFNEIAKNPLNPDRYLSGGYNVSNTLDITSNSFVGTKELNLGEKYGVTNVTLNANCSVNGSRRIGFDHLGRPLKGDLYNYTAPYMSGRLLTNTCKITLSNGTSNVDIFVEPETGYAHIL